MLAMNTTVTSIFLFLKQKFSLKNDHLSLSRVDNGYEHVSSLEDDVTCSEYAFRCPKGWHETGKFTSITMVSIRMFVDNMAFPFDINSRHRSIVIW